MNATPAYRPYALEATTRRRRKCYPMLIIYHVGRIVAILATLAIVALCLGAM